MCLSRTVSGRQARRYCQRGEPGESDRSHLVSKVAWRIACSSKAVARPRGDAVSQPSPADAVRPRPLPAQRTAGQAPRKRRVASQLIVLVAIPVVLGLIVAGLRVTGAVRSAHAYGQAERLAALGEQVTSLARAMEYERADTAAFIADGRPASVLPALHGQYVITDSRAARVRGLVHQLGPGYPAQTQAAA